MWQVTHALLTRPPLSHASLRRVPHGLVRLACVMHAASVHPEPGSNSLVKIRFWIFACWLRILFYLVFVLLEQFFLESFRVGHAVQLSRCRKAPDGGHAERVLAHSDAWTSDGQGHEHVGHSP